MEEKILDIKELYDNGINKKLFFDLLINITNGGFGEASMTYANRLKIDQWRELYGYEHIHVEVNEKQILLFLNYMSKYVHAYVNKDKEYYIVGKNFYNELRTEANFQFEAIVLTVLDIV